MRLSFAAGVATLLIVWCVPALSAQGSFPVDTSGQESYIQRYAETNLWAKQPPFEKMEAFAKELRAKIESHQAYERAMSTYYGYLGIHAATTVGQPIVARWMQRSPTSPVPVLASLTGRFYNAANDFELAIGSNWIWHEPPQARIEMQAIRDELLKVKSYASADPYWYVLMAKTTIALRLGRAEVDTLVDEGLNKYPKNYDLILTAAAAYLSKWGGSAEALEGFAQKVLAYSAPDDGVANYARVYDVALRGQYGVLMFDLSKVDWQLLMKSTREILQKAPTEDHLNAAGVLACAGGNRELTREVLLHDNFRYSDVYWYNVGTSMHPYKICRNWAGGG